MTSTIVRTTRVTAVGIEYDGDELAGASATYNEPDFYDDGKAWWLTPEAAVGCDIGLLPSVVNVVESGSFYARQGIMPEERGISVEPFNPDHQDVSTKVMSKCGLPLDRWWTAWRAIVPAEDMILAVIENQRAIQRAKRRAA